MLYKGEVYMKRNIALLLVVCIITFFGGCAEKKDYSSMIVGSWYCKDYNFSREYIFFEDGDCQANGDYSGKWNVVSQNGVYVLKINGLLNDIETHTIISLDENTLILKIEGEEREFKKEELESMLEEMYSNKEKANDLDSACKILFSSVTSGVINTNTLPEELGNLDMSKLPTESARVSKRLEIAKSLTIQDAIDFKNLDITKEDTENFYFDSDGTIVYKKDYDIENYTALTLSTTFGELYLNNK